MMKRLMFWEGGVHILYCSYPSIFSPNNFQRSEGKIAQVLIPHSEQDTQKPSGGRTVSSLHQCQSVGDPQFERQILSGLHPPKCS